MLRLASLSALLVVISLASYQVSADDAPSFERPVRNAYTDYPKYVAPPNKDDVKSDYTEFEYNVQEAIWDAHDAARLDQNGDHEHIEYEEFSTFMAEFYKKRTNPQNKDRVHLSDSHIRALFRIYDKDHNNKLSKKEALVGLLQHQEFFFFDIDYNGILSKPELLNMHDSPHKAGEKYALSQNIDFLELFQRMLSHNRLKLGWENTMGVVPAGSN
uniref:EF-hand motif protein n=1 Tax=Nilaparvata lugens TaxID=108931 RepID=A0A220XID9_NILLU|nr:EF-hand motif protein [Nilaparvata lugens]